MSLCIIRTSRAAALLVAGLLSTSCAGTPVHDIHVDAGFSAADLAADGLGVAAFIHLEHDVPDEAQLDLGARLAQAIQVVSPDAKVSWGPDVSGALGDLQAQAVDEIRADSALSDATLSALAGSDGLDFRFVAFVRLDHDVIEESEEVGLLPTGGSQLLHTTSRSVHATLSIYDLDSGTLAWRGTDDEFGVTESSDQGASRDTTKAAIADDGHATMLTGATEYRTPPPTVAQMLVPLFEGFASVIFGV